MMENHQHALNGSHHDKKTHNNNNNVPRLRSTNSPVKKRSLLRSSPPSSSSSSQNPKQKQVRSPAPPPPVPSPSSSLLHPLQDGVNDRGSTTTAMMHHRRTATAAAALRVQASPSSLPLLKKKQQQQQQKQQQQQQRSTTSTTSASASSASSANTTKHENSHHHKDSDDTKQLDLEKHVMLGLTLAGVGSSMLTTVFGVFHVDLFLRAYHLPLTVYRNGNFVFSIINTANDVAGAWMVDHIAATSAGRGRRRTDLVALSGLVFCACFLTPFFRPHMPPSDNSDNGSVWADGTHFVISWSLYDTMYSFTAILLGSVVTDNHAMTDAERVQFMMSGKVVNLAVSLCLTRIGLQVFDAADLYPFRLFLVLVVVPIVATLFVVGQAKIHGSSHALTAFWKDVQWRHILVATAPPSSSSSSLATTSLQQKRRGANANGGGGVQEGTTTAATTTNTTRTLVKRNPSSQLQSLATSKPTTQKHQTTTSHKEQQQHHPHHQHHSQTTTLDWRRVVQDFWRHKNFRAWIGMEMCLEAQKTFMSYFLKTFVDTLLRQQEEEQQEPGAILNSPAATLSGEACDWFISIMRPLTQVAAILMYVPIRHFGYPVVYTAVFVANAVLSAAVWWCAAEALSANWILWYLATAPVLTAAIQLSGFHLAMADMVMELKLDRALAGRFGEPSLAGLFMGANALVCKPMESALPMIAATVLEQSSSSSSHAADNDNDNTDNSAETAATTNAQALFSLLVLPPLCCSLLQLLSWSCYDLSPKKTARMRQQLKELLSAHENEQEMTQMMNGSGSANMTMTTNAGMVANDDTNHHHHHHHHGEEEDDDTMMMMIHDEEDGSTTSSMILAPSGTY